MRDLLARHRQFLIYLAGGVASAVIDVGLMHMLIQSGANALAAASVSFGAGLVFNFMFHAKVTFSALASRRSLARYLVVVAVNYLFTLACVALAVALDAPAVLGKLVSLPLVAINGFILGKRWIFQ